MTKRSVSAALFALAPSLVLVASAARADEVTRYTVKSGETCAAIAARVYGDARLVDLIHSANPGMGPAPHALRPGQVLLLPPPSSAKISGPDARLTRMKNVVEVQAPEPRPGKPNDPLFRGNRVATKDSSTADVTFRDETQVKLGENSLVVILGDVQARAARLAAADTTLVTGSLRARLSELAGKGSEAPRVATAAGSVEVKAGESQVTVDGQKTTRLAVYDGSSTLTAQKKTVTVGGNFGSKAELGRPPTPPKALPDAPVWAKLRDLVVTTNEVDLALAFAPATSGAGSEPAEWHVQLSRDATFDEPLVDTRVPLATKSVDVKNAGGGSYFARVSAIDADRFEGRWSDVASVVVAAVTLAPLPGRRSRVTVAPDTVTCGDAGALEIDRASARTIECVTADGVRSSLAVPRVPLGPLKASAQMTGDRHSAVVRVRLLDEGGAPVERVTVALDAAPRGMRLEAFVPTGEAGVYAARATFDPGATGGALRLRVDDESTVETMPLGPPPDAAPPPPPPAKIRFEIAGAARVSRVLEQAGVGGGLAARFAFPTGPGDLLLGVEALLEEVPPGTSDVPGVGVRRVRADVLGFTAPLGLRLGSRRSRLAPYGQIGPALFATRARVGPESSDIPARALALGGSIGLGVELRVGEHGALFVEASGRLTRNIPGTRIGPTIDASGAALSVGFRLP